MENVKGKVILAIGAHPDDLEFGCAGSIAKWVQMGAAAYYIIITDGSKGSEDHLLSPEDLVKTRRQEQQNAAKVLGVKEVFFLGYVDGELENTLQVRRDIVKIIRKVKADVVITMDPTRVYDIENNYINHPDHRAAGQAVLDAVFPFSQNARTFPELIEEGLHSHPVKEVLLINFQQSNYYVDTSSTITTKLEALKQHKSQYNDWEVTKGWVIQRGEKAGKKIDAKYAEGFIRLRIN